MNSSTAILVQMNSAATPLLLLPPCPCNTATPLLTRRCPADYIIKPTLPTHSHGEHCTGDAKLPPHCCRAASANAADAQNKKNGDVAMPNNSLTFNYVFTSPVQ